MRDTNRDRLAVLSGQFRARLHLEFAEWPRPMFEEVVAKLANLALKYEGHGVPYDQRATEGPFEQLIASMREVRGRHQQA